MCLDVRDINGYILMFVLLLFVSCTDESINDDVLTSKNDVEKLLDEADEAYQNGDYLVSLDKNNRCLEYYKEQKDTANMSLCYFQLSSNYHRLGNFKMSINMAEQCLHLDSLLDDTENMSSSYNNLAAICYSSKDLVSARKFIKKAIALEEKTEHKENMSIRYGLASEIYTKSDSANLAYDYAKRAYALDTAAHDTVKIGKRLSQMGDALASMGKLKDAERCYLDAEAYLDGTKDQASKSINYKQLGTLYGNLGLKDKAIIYHEKSLDLSRRHNMNYISEFNLSALSKLYSGSNNDKALAYAQEDMLMKDSIYTQEMQQATQQFSAQYDLWDKENHITKQANRLRIQKIMIWTIFSVFILSMLLMGLWVYLRYMRKEKRKLHIKYSHALVTDFNASVPINETEPLNKDIDTSTESDRIFLLKVNEIISKHIDEASLSSVKISEEICLGQRQVNRKVKAITGIDTGSYIKMKRIGKAKQLLQDGEMAICDVQSACGFDSPSYFSKVFKDVVGVSPSEFKKGIKIKKE